MNNKNNNIHTFIKSYITTFAIFFWLFSISFMSVALYMEYITDEYIYQTSNQNTNNSINNSNSLTTYTIYKDSDPVINKIELFLAQNQNKLSLQEFMSIEKKRQERITEIMAKKYLDITTQANLK